jgi:hypothetical protein
MTVGHASRDWLASTSSNLLAWWLPHAGLLVGLVVPTPVRVVIWMGVACILNSKRCGRTHCRYTGPYYLAMIVPVLALGFISSGIYEWITLAVIIVGGSKLIWWVTERVWGKFS